MGWLSKDKKVDLRGSFSIAQEGTARVQSEGSDGSRVSTVLIALETRGGSSMSLVDLSEATGLSMARLEELIPRMVRWKLIRESNGYAEE